MVFWVYVGNGKKVEEVEGVEGVEFICRRQGVEGSSRVLSDGPIYHFHLDVTNCDLKMEIGISIQEEFDARLL